MKLKIRDIDLIEEKNLALISRIEVAINKLQDDEFIDLFTGSRGSLSFLQSDNGSFKLCEPSCICGGVHNIPCQWQVSEDLRCEGVYCKHYIRR